MHLFLWPFQHTCAYLPRCDSTYQNARVSIHMSDAYVGMCFMHLHTHLLVSVWVTEFVRRMCTSAVCVCLRMQTHCSCQAPPVPELSPRPAVAPDSPSGLPGTLDAGAHPSEMPRHRHSPPREDGSHCYVCLLTLLSFL